MGRPARQPVVQREGRNALVVQIARLVPHVATLLLATQGYPEMISGRPAAHVVLVVRWICPHHYATDI
jgi:hypothetical protein